MRKILTTLLSVALVLGMISTFMPMLSLDNAEAQGSGNTPATMVGNRFHRIGYDRYGRELPDGKMVPWQKVGEVWWGREGFYMPYAVRAVDDPPYSITVPPATAFYSTVVSNETSSHVATLGFGLWTEVWLTVDVDPGDGQTTYKHHWYVILDDYGQLWFDPDGRFNDCRYYGYADPYDVNYMEDDDYTHDNCTDNPRALVDPIVSNNTQGPYILDPDYNPFVNENASMWQFYSPSYALNNVAAPVYNPRIYFWDAEKTGYNTKRLWKLGFADMNDYLAENAVGPAGALCSGVVYEEAANPSNPLYKEYQDWDIDLSLRAFQLNYNPAQFAEAGSEVHAENITLGGNYPDSQVSWAAQAPVAYNFGEFAYRKAGADVMYPTLTGPGTYDTKPVSFVDEADIRLSDIVVTRNGDIRTYPPFTSVIDTGAIGVWEPGDDYDVGTSQWAFSDGVTGTFGRPEYYHDQAIGTNNGGNGGGDGVYSPGEFIYRKALANSGMTVQADDIRLTNVNGYQTNTNRHLPNNPDLLFDTDGMVRAGIMDGDLLIMAEVLNGGCQSPNYDIAVQTDAWIGWRDNGRWMPVEIGYTAAGIRSHFDTTINHFNRVQKNAMLSQNSDGFFVPSTVFHDVQFEERQFGGWSIWLDDGIDNNAAVNQMYACTALDLSDNLEGKETIEQIVGGESLEAWDFDYGRGGVRDDFGELVSFTDTAKVIGPPYGFYDTEGNGFGCHEHLYRDMDSSGAISKGDLRLTDVITYREVGPVSGSMIQYYAGTTVAAGDLDVGEPITYFNQPPQAGNIEFMFYDISHPADGVPRNYEYDPGEDIYLQPIGLTEVDYRSVRATDVEIQGKKYICGTAVSLSQALFVENPVSMISMGNNGLASFMDFEVIPGSIQVEVKVDQEFMVEQTSHVEVRVVPEPTDPDDKYYILIENLPRSSYNNIAETVRTIDRDHLVANFEITPYRGSCDLTGFVQDRKVYVHAIKEETDVSAYSGLLQVPRDGSYYDPYWETVYRDPEKRAYANYARYVFDPVNDPRYDLYATHFSHLANSYDCYGRWERTVQPEDLDIQANRKCLTILEQRFPNLVLTLTNWDNPNDINDPADIRFATESIPDRPHRVNYNCRGAGVKFLFTANNTDFTEKYIVQVNDDDTFICWQWFDYEPLNMLSPLDYLIYRDLGNPGWPSSPQQPDPRNSRGPVNDPPRLPTDAEPESELERCFVDDVDCSGKQATCDICGIGGGSIEDFVPIGSVTLNDTYGNSYVEFIIQTFGVPTMVTDYGYLSTTDPGGQMLVAVLPREADTPLWVRVTAEQTIFNFNSVDGQLWPPNGPGFLNDYTGGVDYCGLISFDITPPDPDVNFTEVTMVDHALQYSQANYTVGSDSDGYHTNPVSPLGMPAPQIQTPYNPILKDLTEEVTCYPGGQTHPFRLDGPNSKRRSGWNAYPAIHSEWYNGTDHSQFVKLGTEFFPLTDYGLYFILKNQRGEHLSFSPIQHWVSPYPIRYDLMIKRVIIEGPFMRPKFMDADNSNYLSNNYYNGTEYPPIAYDTSGRLEITDLNVNAFVQNSLSYRGGDFANVTSPYMTGSDPVRNQLVYPDDTNIPENDYLRLLDRSLDFTSLHFANIGNRPSGANDVFCIDEIIPVNYGNISITVELQNGKRKIYQDCCETTPVDGINVWGLDIQDAPDEIVVDTENVIEIGLREYNDIQVVQECNDALVFCWQDRGVKQIGSDMRVGAGDGWITNPPRNSNLRDKVWQYLTGDDINGDGKITFKDFETEILGTYDMTTNTWLAGIIDARTYQRQDGIYRFELNETNNCIVDEIGFDFGGGEQIGGRFSSADHIISINEELPIWITAYKYGDDNNDRSFQPYYEIPPQSEFGKPGFSHEVYMAAQKSVRVVGSEDLVVEITPAVLTAGVTPEYVDPDEPLTFTVYHPDGDTRFNFFEEGVPDYTGAYKIREWEQVANNLFEDPHPDNKYHYGYDSELPQYYWLRTDLHNNDPTSNAEGVDNHRLFASRITAIDFIEYDFSGGEDGVYIFKGFCANDEGSFPVIIYSPDRKHYARETVKIKPPKVEYKITNIDDPDQRVFDLPGTPGDPEFLMTAADNRVYKVDITCYTHDGEKPLIGAAKGVSVCTGSDRDNARFTPVYTAPSSFLTGEPRYAIGTRGDWMPVDGQPLGQDQIYTPRIRPRLGIDFDADGVVEESNREVIRPTAYTHKIARIYMTSYYFYYFPGVRYQATGGLVPSVYYNTNNYAYPDRYDEKNYYNLFIYGDIYPDPDSTFAWGLGAIYNSSHYGGYLTIDVNDDDFLTYADSLSLDERGSTQVYVYAEDLCYFAGFIGDNPWTNTKWGDVYGGIDSYLSNVTSGYSDSFYGDPHAPRTMQRRYGYRPQGVNVPTAYIPAADGTFKLDWEAFPSKDNYAKIEAPFAIARSAETREPFGLMLMNQNCYDLIYAKENHILFNFYPAFSSDLPLGEGARVDLLIYTWGGTDPTRSYARTYKSAEDPAATECMALVRPTGVATRMLSIAYYQENTRFRFPYEYRIERDLEKRNILPSFDSVRGLEVLVDSEDVLRSQITGTLNITVREYGSNAPAGNAELKIEGAGVSLPSKRCNDKGQASVVVTPTETGIIKVTASLEGYADGFGTITVGVDTQPPTVTIEEPTNYAVVAGNSVALKGVTKPGSKLTVNGQQVAVNLKGEFEFNVNLQNEGANTIVVKATSPTGATTVRYVTVIRDTQAPSLIINEPTEIIANATYYDVTGRVEPGSKVTVNGVDAKVVFDVWTHRVNLVPGKNEVEVTAIDAAGNTVTSKIVLVNYKLVTIELTKEVTTAYVNGEMVQLTAAPRLSMASGTFMVPAGDLFGSLEGNVVNAGGNLFNITLGASTASITQDGKTAQVNGVAKALPEAPARDVATGQLMVPAAVLLQYMNEGSADGDIEPILDIEWNPSAGRMTISRYWIP
ncbi:MAG TPA: hypothetical protein PKV16_06495 [Caldisericia bacterium]|nr:hypothetical protein [Caldisericia bacterium]HPF49709.1 hypothetical protein [Caldisericia bacterium]HPI84581.1 hypothetical protein [Caldisericia bacterium]HPQ93417.1 hypothetical protein [Caldisericia bacterium]HRV74877.1 hypothetical protein [Caldisericia bacterium]